MNKNLLIVGAGTYGVVAKEIAESMGCFETIEFVDDEMKETPNGIKVIGTTLDIENLAVDFSNIFVSIENPEKRLMMISKISEETPCRLVTLVSPLAYILVRTSNARLSGRTYGGCADRLCYNNRLYYFFRCSSWSCEYVL